MSKTEEIFPIAHEVVNQSMVGEPLVDRFATLSSCMVIFVHRQIAGASALSIRYQF